MGQTRYLSAMIYNVNCTKKKSDDETIKFVSFASRQNDENWSC